MHDPLTSYPIHPEVSFFGHEFNSLFGVDYFVLIVWFCILLVLVVNRMKNSRLGRAWIAIREDELVGQCLGINQYRFKMIAFMLSAAAGGIGGSLISVSQSYISYENFSFLQASVLILCCVVLGGMGSIRGAIIGGVLIAGLQLGLQKVINKPSMAWLPKDAQFIVFGLLLVLMMRFRAQGIINIKKPKRHRKIEDNEVGKFYSMQKSGNQ